MIESFCLSKLQPYRFKVHPSKVVVVTMQRYFNA